MGPPPSGVAATVARDSCGIVVLGNRFPVPQDDVAPLIDGLAQFSIPEGTPAPAREAGGTAGPTGRPETARKAPDMEEMLQSKRVAAARRQRFRQDGPHENLLGVNDAQRTIRSCLLDMPRLQPLHREGLSHRLRRHGRARSRCRCGLHGMRSVLAEGITLPRVRIPK